MNTMQMSRVMPGRLLTPSVCALRFWCSVQEPLLWLRHAL